MKQQNIKNIYRAIGILSLAILSTYALDKANVLPFKSYKYHTVIDSIPVTYVESNNYYLLPPSSTTTIHSDNATVVLEDYDAQLISSDTSNCNKGSIDKITYNGKPLKLLDTTNFLHKHQISPYSYFDSLNNVIKENIVSQYNE